MTPPKTGARPKIARKPCPTCFQLPNTRQFIPFDTQQCAAAWAMKFATEKYGFYYDGYEWGWE